MVAKVTFHRTGKVTVEGVEVGEYRHPDPSGAAWSRTPLWIFQSADGRVYQGRARYSLEDHARGAAIRISTAA
jgi:hypothetical protein